MRIGDGGADGKIVLEGGGGGVVEGDGAGEVVFLGADVDLGFFGVLKVEVGQFADSDAGLQKEFDN